MNKAIYWILAIVAIAVVILGSSEIILSIVIKYTGKKVIATVSTIPSQCDKYNQIKVLLDKKEFEVNISRTDCRDGVYKIGQQVTLIRNKKYQKLLWPESQPEFVPLLIIASFILAYISMKGRYKNKSTKIGKS